MTTAQTTTAPTTQTLEATLNKTDMGHFILEHKKSFVAAVLVAFIGAAGYMFWKQSKQKAAEAQSAEVFNFASARVKDLKEGKITPEDFLTQFKSLSSALKSSPSLVPWMLNASHYLTTKDQSKISYDIISELYSYHQKGMMFLYLSHHLAALAEDQEKWAESYTVLDKVAKSGEKVLLTKTYLDLGRMALKKNDKADAKKYFEALIKDHPNDDMTKLAKLYLQQI
jgi:uncharacterized protein HemY